MKYERDQRNQSRWDMNINANDFLFCRSHNRSNLIILNTMQLLLEEEKKTSWVFFTSYIWLSPTSYRHWIGKLDHREWGLIDGVTVHFTIESSTNDGDEFCTVTFDMFRNLIKRILLARPQSLYVSSVFLLIYEMIRGHGTFLSLFCIRCWF
jgi:hypothetical protein